MNREQKEVELMAAYNKADKTSQGFFLYHLSQLLPKPGNIQWMITQLDADEFEDFYADEIDNLKCESPESQEGR